MELCELVSVGTCPGVHVELGHVKHFPKSLQLLILDKNCHLHGGGKNPFPAFLF